MTVASIFTPILNKTQPVEPSVEPALTLTSHARNTFEIKNIRNTLVMRRQKSNASAKRMLGVRPRTHYMTILKQPNNKSKAYLHPEMTEAEVRGLVKKLTTASAKQRSALKLDAAQKRRQFEEKSRQKKLLMQDILRTSRRLNRKRNFEEPSQTTFVVGEMNDQLMGPAPQYCILTILKKFAGKHIRIVAHNGTAGEQVRLLTPAVDKVRQTCMLVNINLGEGPMVRDAYHRFENEWVPVKKPKEKTGDHTYFIPKDRINKYFRNKNKAYDWLLQYAGGYHISPGHPIPYLHPGDVLKVVIIEPVKPLPKHRSQSFAQGIDHCLLQPIINDFSEKMLLAKSKSSKSNYNCGIKVLTEYKEKYRSGIPETVLPQLVEDVSKKVQINIEITIPLATNQFLTVRNSYGHGKNYKFTNTRLDHVDINAISLQNIQSQGRHRTFEIIDVSREQMMQIHKQHLDANMHIEWMCDKTGITKLWSTTRVWKCNSDFSDTVADFEEDAGLRRLMVDHVNNKDLSEFILAGTHYCCSVPFQAPPDDLTGIKCADIHKSYARPHDCRFYEECKFPNKITRFSPIDSVKGPGLYLIKDIDWSQAVAKFKDLMKRQGEPIQDNNIYAVPILKLLDFHCVKYKIVAGCWAGGDVNTYDLKLSDKIIEKKYYKILFGKWNQIRETNSYFMRGSQELAGHILRYAPNAEADWQEAVQSWDPPEGVINIRYPQKHIWHLSQFSAYINAYEFVKMADQLMLCDLTKIVQIQKDDFMYWDHEFKMLPYFRDKTAEILQVDETGISKARKKVGVIRFHIQIDTSGMEILDNINKGAITFEQAVKELEELLQIYHSQELRTRLEFVKKEFDFRNMPAEILQVDETHTNMATKKVEAKHFYVQRNTSGQEILDNIIKGAITFEQAISKLEHLLEIHQQSHNATREDVRELKHRLEFVKQSNTLKTYTLQGTITRQIEPLVQKQRKLGAETVLMRQTQLQDFLGGTTLCYLHNLTEFQPECVSRMLAACVAHDLRNAHIQRVVAPVVAHIGPGGTGKTDEALRDPRRQRTIYIAPSHKLSRAKSSEYNLCTEGDEILKQIEEKLKGLRKGDRKTLTNIKDGTKLQVTVWRRLLNENPEIWKRIDRYANTLVIDEVSMMWTETAQFIMQRFPNHEIVFAGDAGYQLPAFKTKEDSGPKTPFNVTKLNIPVIEFNKIFRVTCDRQLAIRMEGRKMIEQQRPIADIEGFYMSQYRVITSEEEVVQLYESFSFADGQYEPKDLIICSTNEACEEWTDLLAPLQPSTNSGVIQKYHIKSCSRDYSNGEIVMSIGPPAGVKSEVAHAFTAHSTIGETAVGKVFIDRRRMWETEHWETIVGRARRAEDIIIIDLPNKTPSEEYSKNINYIISSVKGGISYIGSTTRRLEARKRGHKRDQRCMSHKVIKFDDWTMEKIEDYPCANKREAEARELYWIQRTPNCVNKNLLTTSTGPYTENRIEYIDGKNLQLLINELSKYSVSNPTKPRKSMSNEERELDNIRLFKSYVMTLHKKVEINNKGESFINVTYTRKSCGGRRYSIGEFQDEMGSAKKISYSLQGMYGILRRFLIGKWCHDIDIVNCIPTILIQIAEQDQVPYRYRETLGFYIMHRQQCLEEIMEHHACTKEDAKDAVIRTYNGGTFKKWADDCSITLNKSEPCPFLEDLKEEIEGMKSHMFALPKYKVIRNACLKLKSDKSIDQAASDRSAFATICFKKEDEILQAMEQSINNDGWRSETLIYDGIPVYDRNGLSLEPSLRRAEDYVFQQTGIHIELAEKPMFNENLTVHNVLSHISNR